MSKIVIGDEVKVTNRRLATYNRIGTVIETGRNTLRVRIESDSPYRVITFNYSSVELHKKSSKDIDPDPDFEQVVLIIWRSNSKHITHRELCFELHCASKHDAIDNAKMFINGSDFKYHWVSITKPSEVKVESYECNRLVKV